MLTFVIFCCLCAVVYGLWTSKTILSLDQGNEKMQEIALAIQEGAKAYLNRQYRTIAIVGFIISVSTFSMKNLSAKGTGDIAPIPPVFSPLSPSPILL